MSPRQSGGVQEHRLANPLAHVRQRKAKNCWTPLRVIPGSPRSTRVAMYRPQMQGPLQSVLLLLCRSPSFQAAPHLSGSLLVRLRGLQKCSCFTKFSKNRGKQIPLVRKQPGSKFLSSPLLYEPWLCTDREVSVVEFLWSMDTWIQG